MKDYIATFYTHLAAIMAYRALNALNINAVMMPVPRAVSSSCGTCVKYSAVDPYAAALGEDCEGIFLIRTGKRDEYECIFSNE